MGAKPGCPEKPVSRADHIDEFGAKWQSGVIGQWCTTAAAIPHLCQMAGISRAGNGSVQLPYPSAYRAGGIVLDERLHEITTGRCRLAMGDTEWLEHQIGEARIVRAHADDAHHTFIMCKHLSYFL